MTTDHAHPGGTALTAVQRRLPGTPRPREDVLRECQEATSERRARIDPCLWPFWAPDPDVFYRWRIQLDCGHVSEIMTRGDERLPADSKVIDPISRAWLPEGQVFCHEDAHRPEPSLYREIAEWGERREITFPADPPEPPDWATAEIWMRLRHDQPHTVAFWAVTLACGHVSEVSSDTGWRPADRPRRVSAKRLREMIADFEATEAESPDWGREHGHMSRMLAAGWPTPQTETTCYACPRARPVVAYQRTGWLVPRKPARNRQEPPHRRRVPACGGASRQPRPRLPG
jgi:hypothetical protein